MSEKLIKMIAKGLIDNYVLSEQENAHISKELEQKEWWKKTILEVTHE